MASGKFRLHNGKFLLSPSGKFAIHSDCCCESDITCTACSDVQDATASGGKTPLDWGDACTWVDDSTWVGNSFSDATDSCRWEIVETDPSPQGVWAYARKTKSSGLWDCWIENDSGFMMYNLTGAAKNTFTCDADTGVLSGTATLVAVGDCAGAPNVSFTIG